MKIILVDDNQQFRDNLKMYLEEHLKHTVVGEAVDGDSFLKIQSTLSDIILMDINMPGLGGLDATKKGTWQNKNLKIIAVSQYNDTVDLQQLIGVGFKGFVSKTNLFRDLDKAIKTVSAGGYFFPEELKIMK